MDGRSNQDVKALQTSEKTSRCDNGGYTVGMLWNSLRSSMPNNDRSAVKQFFLWKPIGEKLRNQKVSFGNYKDG